MLKVDHSFKSDTFRTVLTYPDLPVCRIFKDGKTNPLIMAIIEDVRPRAPEILEICTRSGRISAHNFSLDNAPGLDMWPSGKYKVWLKFFDKLDDNIVNLSYTTTIF